MVHSMEQVENTAFIKEFQRRESKDSIHFLKNLPADKKAELTGKSEYLNTTAPLKSALKNTTAKDAQAHMSDTELLNHLSMNLWRRINAGYMIERRKCLSLSRDSYQYDSKLLEKTDREFMHKRDMFSEYVEAAARFKCLIKDGHVATVPKYVPRALRPQTPGRKWYAPVMKLPPGYKESGQATTPATPPAK
ncbi:hypothetical protein MPTK1_5g18950 [Marchantia polymorpha subsp. ruderalis]|uniref:Uncharacterized protein n=2 Tax=Marchantia polymorpha TaxID=3197 RepID=A0AAF6BJW9_MARPO|nr:hypothetical protein MARPO_0073s0048 [Marchantia polymorpha]BBN12303.1 hypothetical protein Mp_5g18950 [Marchantia polymorpha subsp. ruderalis]|eukprot:PTQ35174.1 hypothetical protein MARPO_0073s0048 [Marchantia polymorpha]